MKPKYFLAAQLWYGLSQGVAAFVNPFLNLYFDQLHFTGAQIGLLSALRPWISAPCGGLLAALADRWGAHRAFLVGTFAACIAAQGAMALARGFPLMLALTILASAVWTPSSIIADAAVMAAAEHPGDYGRARTWASLTWTLCSPIAGLVNAHFGIPVGIACYAVGSVAAIPTALALPVQALRRKVAHVIERAPSAPAPGAKEEQVPLLAEVAPAPAAAGAASPRAPTPALPRAIAIIRFIEAITEMGVAPPTGAQIYGFAELSTPFAAAHLDPHRRPPSPFREAPGGEGADGARGWQPDISFEPQAPDSAAGDVGPPGGSPHATSLPRPISAESLGRVASLVPGLGIPPIRTRPQLQDMLAQPRHGEGEEHLSSPVSEPVSTPSLGEEGIFSQEGLEPEDAAQQAQQAPQEGRVHGGSASPFAQPPQPAAWGLFPSVPPPPRPGAESALPPGAAEGADGAGGEEWARGRAPLVLDGAPSASLLLRDVRSIATSGSSGPRSGPRREGPAVGQAAAGAGAITGGPGAPAPPPRPAPPGPGGEGGIPSQGAEGASDGAQVAEVAEAASTPGASYRSAAVQRLIDIFGGRVEQPGGSRSGHRARQEPAIIPGDSQIQGRGDIEGMRLQPAASSGTEASMGGVLEAVPSLAAEPAGEEGMGVLEPGSVAAWSHSGFMTPVRRYIEYRKDKLERKQRQAERPTRPTPFSAARAAQHVLGAELAAVQLRLSRAEELVTSELMREAVHLEATSVTDPTDSLVISMLGKKLERMAREQERAVRRRRQRGLERAPLATASLGAEERAEEGRADVGAEAGAAGQEAAPAPAGPASARAKVVWEPSAKAEAAAEARGFWASLGTLLRDPEVVTFFVLCLVMGFGHGVLGSYLFMFLARLGGSPALMGYVLTANALPELPVFYFFGPILHMLGMHTLLLVSAAALGLRLLAYLVLPSWGMWWVVPIETLHAVTFACGWSACAINSSKISPPGLESTTQGKGHFRSTYETSGCWVQGLFQGLWTGLGSGTGGLIGGLLYHHMGPESLFRLSGLAILGCTAISTAIFLILRWRRKAREGAGAEDAGYERLHE